MVEAQHGLLHGPLSPGTMHLCLDMQKLFAPSGPWPTPWMARVLPVTVKLAEAFREHTVFTRFIPPVSADVEIGVWRRFYRRWEVVTRQKLPLGMLDLVDELAAFAPPATVVDKTRLSAFSAAELATVLNARGTDTLIISGAETDMCVLASVLGAVDRGYRVIVVTDAICSSSDSGHDALMTLYRERFTEQIEAVESAIVLEAWRG
ncbi:MAG: cysteine hydrolase [Xanthobacteraceae bacterium]|jgi:nicotinamidase-related amidase|nr:cysteine hydrolase [Xanthobacteraceae bacterium]